MAPKKGKNAADGAQAHEFQAEVSKLLQLMVHSVYSDKEIFLRELISNAADACERLRYRAIEEPDLTKDDPSFKITITVDADGQQLILADNGIGMEEAELIENLGTIARSGTRAFLDGLKDSKDGSALIGQFGVGFYSAFMVADSVTVVSKKAGSQEAHQWQSDGSGSFTISAVEDDPLTRGTRVTLSLPDEMKEFADAGNIERIIKTYSAHIPVAIEIIDLSKEDDERQSQVTDGSALWTKSRSDISQEDYSEFYKTVSGQFDEPELTIHYRAEGRHEYSVMLFIPSMPPFDLFDPDRRGRLKLYVRRVFISDEAELLPAWLRFVRGVIDSEDLPLNLSREMLQNNPIIEQIRKGVTNRILSELTKLADKEPEKFKKVWEAFGAVIKEALYEDMERRDKLLDLVRFKSFKSGDEWISLKDYIADIKDNQTAIYYALGQDSAALKAGPHLEGFEARDLDVLLLSDPVDAFWVQTATGYDGKPFKSVSQGSTDLEQIKKTDADTEDDDSDAAKEGDADVALFITQVKEALGEAVTDVRKSERLSKTAVCIVASDFGPDRELQRMMARHRGEAVLQQPILEINPKHKTIANLAARHKSGSLSSESMKDAAHTLLDLANILDGEAPSDPAGFCARTMALMEE